MKKVILIVGLLVVYVFGANEAEEFFYNRGFEAGYNQGFEIGVKAMEDEAKNILLKYADDIKAYEIGKYLVRDKKLTSPRIWQERGLDGTLRIVIVQSEIIDELNIVDIFAKYGNIPTRTNSEIKTLDDVSRNSVYLTNRDNSVAAIPSASNRDKAITTLNLNKSWKNKDILQKANLVYSEDSDFYKVIFFTSKEKRDFCDNFGVCK
jgi:hypothetical protein